MTVPNAKEKAPW